MERHRKTRRDSRGQRSSESDESPDKAVVAKEIPRYAEIIKKGIGSFLRDPAKADPGKIHYE